MLPRQHAFCLSVDQSPGEVECLTCQNAVLYLLRKAGGTGLLGQIFLVYAKAKDEPDDVVGYFGVHFPEQLGKPQNVAAFRENCL